MMQFNDIEINSNDVRSSKRINEEQHRQMILS